MWCAHFPTVVNTWHHNFFPAGTSSRQDIPVLPTQTNRTCQANKETQPKSNVAGNPSVQVSELFLLLCQVQYCTWHSNKMFTQLGNARTTTGTEGLTVQDIQYFERLEETVWDFLLHLKETTFCLSGFNRGFDITVSFQRGRHRHVSRRTGSWRYEAVFISILTCQLSSFFVQNFVQRTTTTLYEQRQLC